MGRLITFFSLLDNPVLIWAKIDAERGMYTAVNLNRHSIKGKYDMIIYIKSDFHEFNNCM